MDNNGNALLTGVIPDSIRAKSTSTGWDKKWTCTSRCSIYHIVHFLSGCLCSVERYYTEITTFHFVYFMAHPVYESSTASRKSGQIAAENSPVSSPAFKVGTSC